MAWWADWWNGIARFFGYDVWQWGTTADWVVGLLTAAALIGTVVTIVSDKRRDQRKTANSFVTWVAGDPYGGTPQATGQMPSVMIENLGDMPVLGVQVNHSDGSGFVAITGVTTPTAKHGSFPPGASEEIDIPNYSYSKHDRLWVNFIDSHNQQWIRDAQTGKYLRRKPWPYSSPWVWAEFHLRRLKNEYDERAEARAAEKLSPSTKKNRNKKTK